MSLKDLLPELPQSVSGKLPQLPEGCLKPVIMAFEENHFRWQSHRVVAEAAALRGMQYERAYRRMLWNKLGRPFQVIGDQIDDVFRALLEEMKPHSEFKGDTGGVFVNLHWEYVFGDHDWSLDNKCARPADSPEEADFVDIRIGPTVPSSDAVDRAVRTTFESQIVSAWTMFETLAADLWVAAVNDRPKPLALLEGDMHRIKSKIAASEEDKTQKQQGSKRYAPEALFAIAATFDVSAIMGDFYREQERVSFISLRRIRQAYSEAFGVDHSQIDISLSASELDSLALVRNAIVHAAGHADSDYVKGHTYLPNVPFNGPDKKFPLDAISTNKLILPVVELCTNLINAVDTWLKTHKK